jgi:hypothetical protein
VRSSHMYVGPEGQAVTIHRQVRPNLCMQPTAICFRRSALRAPIALPPCAPPPRPLHAAPDTVVGHQVPPLNVLSCSGCPTVAERSGCAAFSCTERWLFTAVPCRDNEALPLLTERLSRNDDVLLPATESTRANTCNGNEAAIRIGRFLGLGVSRTMSLLIAFATPMEVPLFLLDDPRVYRFEPAPSSGYVFGRNLHVYAIADERFPSEFLAIGRDLLSGKDKDERMRQYLREKGWPGARIVHVVGSKGHSRGSRRTLSSILDTLLRKTIDAQGKLELIIHVHKAEYETESFHVRETHEVDCSDDWPQFEMQDDVRYVFFKKR